MPDFLLYPVKLSCSIAVIWIFYRYLLRNLTFYNLNRYYLAGYTVLCFLIPLVDLGPMLDKGSFGGYPQVTQLIPSVSAYTLPVTAVPAVTASPFHLWGVVEILMATGSCLLLARTALRWNALVRIRRRSMRIGDAGGISIYQVNGRIMPFSFGNAVYINRHLHTEKEWEEIILHEFVHIQQRHTLDIMLAELLVILNWYNPFAWTMRYSIRQNLEFIADDKVLQKGLDRKGYQYHLLNACGDHRYRIGNNFNYSSLKKRIIMMNRLRSARLHLVRFLFIIPLLAVLLVAFRDRYTAPWSHTHGLVFVNVAGIAISLPEKAPLAGVAVHERGSGLQTVTDERGFYFLHIPVMDSAGVHIRIDYSKEGYDSAFNEQSWPSLTRTTGLIEPIALPSRTEPLNGAYMNIPPSGQAPEEPGYADALAGLREVVQANEAASQVIARRMAHPEVSLFYDVEGGQKHIVVRRDGTVERYGYPDMSPIAAMEEKYGRLPQWPGVRRRPNTAYLGHWERIAAEAQKKFRTDNPNVLHVIFPGDSRVIVVKVNGDARFYDMDSDQADERKAFESEYGKLPDCVPPTWHPGATSQPHAMRDADRIPSLAGVIAIHLKGNRQTLHTKQCKLCPSFASIY